jgi:predicted neutral ceramidase superfamily lipid hydrolase
MGIAIGSYTTKIEAPVLVLMSIHFWQTDFFRLTIIVGFLALNHYVSSTSGCSLVVFICRQSLAQSFISSVLVVRGEPLLQEGFPA